jgi:hypothetical protein
MQRREVLDSDFLEIRARLLQIAASLDRLDRAEGTIESDARLERIAEALNVLSSAKPGRAEAIQLIFSLPYIDSWREAFGIKAGAGADGRPLR